MRLIVSPTLSSRFEDILMINATHHHMATFGAASTVSRSLEHCRVVTKVNKVNIPVLDSFRACLAINTIQVCLSCQFKQMPLTPGIDGAKEAGLAPFIGIGQRTATYHVVDAQMIHTGSIGCKTKAGLTQGTQIAKHGIEHHNQM